MRNRRGREAAPEPGEDVISASYPKVISGPVGSIGFDLPDLDMIFYYQTLQLDFVNGQQAPRSLMPGRIERYGSMEAYPPIEPSQVQ